MQRLPDTVGWLFAMALPLLLFGLLLLQRRYRKDRTISPLTAPVTLVSDLGEQLGRLLVTDNHAGVCLSCGSTDPGVLYLEYRRISFLHLLGFTSEKKYFRLCTACGEDAHIETTVAEVQLVQPPRIPSTNKLFFKIVGFTMLGFFFLAIVDECARR